MLRAIKLQAPAPITWREDDIPLGELVDFRSHQNAVLGFCAAVFGRWLGEAPGVDLLDLLGVGGGGEGVLKGGGRWCCVCVGGEEGGGLEEGLGLWRGLGGGFGARVSD